MNKNIKKGLKIIGYTLLVIVILADLFIVIGFTQSIENEYGINELQKYYNCGQESQFTRALCLSWDIQREIIETLGEGIGL